MLHQYVALNVGITVSTATLAVAAPLERKMDICDVRLRPMDFTCSFDVRHSYTTLDLHLRSIAPKLDSQLYSACGGVGPDAAAGLASTQRRHRQRATSAVGDQTAKLKVKPIQVVVNFR